MTPFSTIVGQYNATLLTLVDTQHSILALDAKSRLIQDHTTSSIKIGDGVDILRVLTHDAPSSLNETALGILVVRNDDEGTLVDTDHDFTFLQVDDRGRLRVTSSTTGAEGDECCDELGANTPPAEVGSVGTSTWVDVVDIPIAASTVYNVCAVDATADRLSQFRLVVWDASQDPGNEIIKYIRKFAVSENVPTIQLTFPREIEIPGGATLSIKLQAIRLRIGTNATVSGGINGFVV